MKEVTQATHSRLTKAAAFIAANAPPLLAKYFRPDCCIAASKVASVTLNRLGFSTLPQATTLEVYTDKLWKRLESGKFKHPYLPGEYSVGVGFGQDKRLADPNWKGYAGHLCVLAFEGSEKFLVDLSFGQASRPLKGMPLPGGLALRLSQDLPATVKVNDAVAHYRPIVNPGFYLSPDWTEEERTEPIIEHLLFEYFAST